MREAEEARSREAAAVDDHGGDPFECLPEHIIHRILSLLPSNKERAGTTFVSKSLWYAYSSHPKLGLESFIDFDVSDFLPKEMMYSMERWGDRRLREMNDQFLSFVDEAVARDCERTHMLQRLKICAILMDIDRSKDLLDKWIGMALYNGAQELHLKLYEVRDDCSYSVPARVFSSSSIKILSLSGKELTMPLDSLANTVNLNSLRSLKFFSTPLDESMLQTLLRGCPLTEELELAHCEPLTQVIISCPNNLRIIALNGSLNRVEIEAPSLEELECSNSVSYQSSTQLVLSDPCPRVKHLKLRGCAFNQDQFQELVSRFPLLESLTMGCFKWFKKIIIPNPLLEKIEIEDCYGLADIEIGSPNLSCFRYETLATELPFIRMPNPAAISVCEAKFEAEWQSILEPNWFIKLREFLTRSCQYRSISLDFDLDYLLDGDRGIVQDTSNALPSLPYDVDCLHLSVCTHPSSNAAILNMILSLCRPTTLQVRPYYGGPRESFLKFVCDKLENRGGGGYDDVCCCCSAHRNCWLHELKGVEIERIAPSDDHNRGPLDWRTLREMWRDLSRFNVVYFRLHWK